MTSDQVSVTGKLRRNSELPSQALAEGRTWVQSKLTEINAEIKKLVRQSEELGEEGNVDAAQAAATQAERLKVGKVLSMTDQKEVARIDVRS